MTTKEVMKIIINRKKINVSNAYSEETGERHILYDLKIYSISPELKSYIGMLIGNGLMSEGKIFWNTLSVIYVKGSGYAIAQPYIERCHDVFIASNNYDKYGVDSNRSSLGGELWEDSFKHALSKQYNYSKDTTNKLIECAKECGLTDMQACIDGVLHNVLDFVSPSLVERRKKRKIKNRP